MADSTEALHKRLEELEARLSKARKELTLLDDNRRQGLGALAEAISEQIDEYENDKS